MSAATKGTPIYKSSPVYKSSPMYAKDEKITWDKEVKDEPIIKDNDKGGKTTTININQEGTSKRPSRGEAKGPKVRPGDKGYDAYIASKTLKHKKSRQEVSDTEGKVKPIPKIGPKPLPVETEENVEPAKYRPKRKSKGSSKRRRDDKPGTVVSRTLKKVGRKIKKVVSKCKNNMCGPSNYKSKFKRKDMIANSNFGKRSRR